MIRRRGNSLEVSVYLGRDAMGKRRSVSRTVRGTNREAQRRAKALEVELTKQAADGQSFEGSSVTFAALLDRWLADARMEESTRYQAGRTIERYVKPRLGSVKLAKLRASHFDGLYRDLLRGFEGQRALSSTTVMRVHTACRAALNLAVRWDWLEKNPVLRAQAPGEEPVEPAPPSPAVLAALLAAAEPDFRCFLRLAAVTGMRRGELCALRRSDLDLDAGILRKRRALGVGSGTPYEKPTKTGARHPIALGAPSVEALAALLARQDLVAAEFEMVIGDGFVFSHEPDCSVPWHPQTVSRRFRALCDSVPAAEGVELRSLRHWMVTEGLELGALRTVSGRAGHSRTSTTTDKYAAWVPAGDRALAAALDAKLDMPDD